MIDSQLNDASAALPVGSEVESGPSIGAAGMPAPSAAVSVCNPLSQPYRTGSYLIYDLATGGPDHFRDAMTLGSNRYPASGSHQLNVGQLRETLTQVADLYKPRNLFLVDLREETHGFIDGRAASWYADNDFGNVGLPPSLIRRDEQARLGALEGQTTQVFTIQNDQSDDRGQQRVMPVSYEEVAVTTVSSEETSFDNLELGACTVHYLRIPVTDHCAPSAGALLEFSRLPVSVDPTSSWVHFHCHGGDGRTTTFLALYDMVCWKRWSNDLFPELETFAGRQCELPPNYCLNPDGCDCGAGTSSPVAGWKRPLEVRRWEVLKAFHQSLLAGSGL